jgi:hypothetical protein
MIAFRVKVNGRKVATAGLSAYHLVSAHIRSFRRRTRATMKGRRKRGGKPDLSFSVTGLLSSPDGTHEHFSWASLRALKVGDALSLKVVETDRVDEPTRRPSPNKALREAMERRQLRDLLKKYGGTPTGGDKRHNLALQRAGRRPARR